MVKDVQGAFRISLGPLDYDEFVAFLPDGPRMAELCALTRAYVGPELSFDVQLTAKGREIPDLVLSKTSTPRLGWNTWLPTRTPRTDTTDAVFRTDAI
jgi:type VI secretion system protein ImpH